MLIKGRDIVVFGIQAWDIEIGSNCRNIALEFARHNRVLYVNPPLDRATLLRQGRSERIQKRIRIRNRQQTDLEQLTGNLWNLYPPTLIESANWLPSTRLFRWLNRKNSRRLADDIYSALTRLGFKDYLLFNDSSMFLGYHLGEYLKPANYLYYMRDNLLEVPYWRRHGLHMEPELLAKADAVVTNSELYTEYAALHNPNSHTVGQGCDLRLFQDADGSLPVPRDLRDIPGPILGYVGYLSGMRLDIGLLEYLAAALPEWQLVLVGPEDAAFRQSNLHHMPNVHFLGSREPGWLPAYIKGFDVAMNPQRRNAWTEGNYPRKIDEYLAMGKPVLATRTRAMEMFAGHVYLANSAEQFATLAYSALREDTPENRNTRRAFAASHSWENSVKAIYRVVSNTKNL